MSAPEGCFHLQPVPFILTQPPLFCLALSSGLFTLAQSHFRLRFRADWSVTSRVYVNVCDKKAPPPPRVWDPSLFSSRARFCCLCLSSPLRECHSLSEVLSKRDKRNPLHAVHSNVCLDMKTSGVFYMEEEKKCLQCFVQTC